MEPRVLPGQNSSPAHSPPPPSLRAPKAPDATADMGRHEFTYALMPHKGECCRAPFKPQFLQGSLGKTALRPYPTTHISTMYPFPACA